MADTHTTSLRLRLLEVNANEDTWGTELNENVINMLEEAIAGIVSISVTGSNVTLTTANGTTDQSRNALIILTGTPGTTRTVTFPNVEKLTWVYNSSNADAILTAGAGSTETLGAGTKALMYSDGALNIRSLSYITEFARSLLDDETAAEALATLGLTSGTFTPTVAFGGGTTGITYSAQVGRYEKVGRSVHVRINIILTNKGSSAGAVTVNGLPLAVENTANSRVVWAANVVNMANLGSAHVMPYSEPGSSGINLDYLSSSTSTHMDETHFTNTSQLILMATYEAEN